MAIAVIVSDTAKGSIDAPLRVYANLRESGQRVVARQPTRAVIVI